MSNLLCLSNGHGEDTIATQILQQLQLLPNCPHISALPIVGEGKAYQKLGIPIIGTVQPMPSGGFIYMEGAQLWQDIRSGLLSLTISQYQAIQKWAATVKGPKLILAVGDLVPMLFAYLCGVDYAFVGTAKSEYYLRNEQGWLATTSRWERYLGSVYLPWERWLMNTSRCVAVFPRDTLTTEVLRKYNIKALDLGNPMMDGLEMPMKISTSAHKHILLLPGSRAPEAYRNWKVILKGANSILENMIDKELVFIGAIAPSINMYHLQEELQKQQWQPWQPSSPLLPDPEAQYYKNNSARLVLSQNSYSHCLHLGDWAIAMAGTATEQFVGLGKGAIAIPGEGPQYTYAFAEAQSRLLGPSLILVESAQQVGETFCYLVNNPQQQSTMAENGTRRLGKAGAAQRIAQTLIDTHKNHGHHDNEC